MSTNSRIAIVNSKDKTVRSIYCHWDGYPSYNGSILLEHYQDEEKINELIDLGSISSLRKNIKPETDTHSFNTPDGDVVVAYHRDRGEDLNIDKHGAVSSWQYKPRRQEFNYIWMNGKWYFQGSTQKNLVELTESHCK